MAGDRECVDIVAIQDFFDEPINEEFFFLALFPIESQSTALNIDPDTMLAIVTVVDRKNNIMHTYKIPRECPSLSIRSFRVAFNLLCMHICTYILKEL